MDPVTQGAVGAAVTVAVARPEETRRAAVLGVLAGMAPDLDVLIRSSSDPLLFLAYHRQFTHSIAFVPVGAFLCAMVAFPLFRRTMSPTRIYLFCFLGYATHGLLDAFTSYGTQLLWPFSDTRVAWNVVSVVDPFFTVPLLGLVAFAATRRRPGLARVACAWGIAYLALGVVQHERAESHGYAVARSRGHEASSLTAKPAFGSLLLWKTVYASGGRYYVDAVRLGGRVRAFPGESIERLDRARDLPWLSAGVRQARDLERFRWFSDDHLALDPDRADHVIDVRYSMIPNQIDALWGIRLRRDAGPADPADFYTDRASTPEMRAVLVRMLTD